MNIEAVVLFLCLSLWSIQLDMVVQFILSRTGHVPDCSPLVNCALLMAIGFVPIFPVTLLRVLTPMQFTSTFRWGGRAKWREGGEKGREGKDGRREGREGERWSEGREKLMEGRNGGRGEMEGGGMKGRGGWG